MKVSDLLDALQEAVDSGGLDGDSEVLITDNARRCAKNLTVTGLVPGVEAWQEASSYDEDGAWIESSAGAEAPDEAKAFWLVLGYEHHSERYTPKFVLDWLEGH